MKEFIPDIGFKMMGFIMKIMELVHPQAEIRAKTFGILEGMTIVDYGCGPGRYTIPFAKLVGRQGKLIAVDQSRVALEAIDKKAKTTGWITFSSSWQKDMTAVWGLESRTL
jgi:ubiquinone/menaquinone biosynthesis C-methylase UbiE